MRMLLQGQVATCPCDMRPVYFNNSMNMIWHYNERIQFNLWEMLWGIIPAFLHNLTSLIQLHLPIHHLTKQFLTLPCNHGDEIRTRLGVVISLQADGSPPVTFLYFNMFDWINIHC